MNRIEILCEYYIKKDFSEIDSSFQHERFATNDEKRAMKLLLRNNINVATIPELKLAEEIGKYFIKNNCYELKHYQDRLKKIQEKLKSFRADY